MGMDETNWRSFRAGVSSMECSRQHAERAIKYSVEDMPEKVKREFEEAPEVGVSAKVIRISHVDMASDTFMADFNVNVAWRGHKGLREKLDVQMYNAMELDHEDVSDVKEGDAGFDFYYRIHIKGTFWQKYDLTNFPLDSQELTVRVRLKSTYRLIHLPWGPGGTACSCDPGAFNDEYELELVDVHNSYWPSYKFGKLAGYDPEAHVIFSVNRNSGYWIKNYGAFMSLVASFSFAAFAIQRDDVSGRLGIGFTLNLTVVATFYLMQDKFPAEGYWTLLEKHMLTCIAFTMLVMVIIILSAVFGDDFLAMLGEDFMATLEVAVFWVLVVSWLCYHVWVKWRIAAIVKEKAKPKLQF